MPINTNFNVSNHLFNPLHAQPRNIGSINHVLGNLSTLPAFPPMPGSNNNLLRGINTAPSLRPDVRTFLENAKLSANRLSSALGNLLGTTRTPSSFSGEAVSSNNNLLSVSSADNRGTPSNLNTRVQIDQVATTQINTGTSLNSGDSAVASGFSAGAQSVGLNVNGRTFAIDFSVSEDDTNEDVQERIAEAINARNAGVAARVEHDAENNTSALIIESTGTGAAAGGEPRFTIDNISGDAFGLLGIDNISQHAQNALYSINGGAQRTSGTNVINVGDGITATLRAPGTAEITVERNHEASLGDIRNMVQSFNSLLAAAENNRSDRRTNALHTQLLNTSRSYSGSLGRLGINVSADGSMQIDEARLTEAAESGRLEAFITESQGRNYGFAARLRNIADRVDRNPAAHVTLAYEDQNSSALNSLSARQRMQFARLDSIGLLLHMVL